MIMALKRYMILAQALSYERQPIRSPTPSQNSNIRHPFNVKSSVTPRDQNLPVLRLNSPSQGEIRKFTLSRPPISSRHNSGLVSFQHVSLAYMVLLIK
ncbi:hypothetical protein CEXT_739691 [Caerostris extrusa]|uniref:Uncharacterized protein n=1 Tax=Caerostris extrusa TaxID=172846 RepID=A0AAV4U8Y7_CAEEX|nr:hypothetical protein CEXT_739691 [Caerostris extrusa]